MLQQGVKKCKQSAYTSYDNKNRSFYHLKYISHYKQDNYKQIHKQIIYGSMKDLSNIYVITLFRTTTVLTVLYCGLHILLSRHVCTCLGVLFLFASGAKNLFPQIHVNTGIHISIRDIFHQSNTDWYLSI